MRFTPHIPETRRPYGGNRRGCTCVISPVAPLRVAWPRRMVAGGRAIYLGVSVKGENVTGRMAALDFWDDDHGGNWN